MSGKWRKTPMMVSPISVAKPNPIVFNVPCNRVSFNNVLAKNEAINQMENQRTEGKKLDVKV
jgi:hypothetical protein